MCQEVTMKNFIFVLFILSVLAGCSAQNKKIERVLTKPLFPKFSGKFPAILNVFQNGGKISVNIGNPYKTSFKIVVLNDDFELIYSKEYNIEVPGIHKIDIWQPSGDYILYSFDNKNIKSFCCYDKNFDEIKLYKPKKIKITDNVIFFGEFIKYNSKDKLYLACIVNNNNISNRLIEAGKKTYKNE